MECEDATARIAEYLVGSVRPSSSTSSGQHVEPLRVAGIAISVMQGIGVVLVQPVVTIEEEELLAAEHAGEGLAQLHWGNSAAADGGVGL